jgi:hypothetical protein
MLQLQELQAKVELMRAQATDALADAHAKGIEQQGETAQQAMELQLQMQEAEVEREGKIMDIHLDREKAAMQMQVDAQKHDQQMQAQAQQHNQKMAMQRDTHEQQLVHKEMDAAANLEVKKEQAARLPPRPRASQMVDKDSFEAWKAEPVTKEFMRVLTRYSARARQRWESEGMGSPLPRA